MTIKEKIQEMRLQLREVYQGIDKTKSGFYLMQHILLELEELERMIDG